MARPIGRWYRAMGEGWYISDNNKFNAKLRPAGKYDFGADGIIPCTRHYAIYRVGSDTMIATARTLKEAERYIV